MSNNAHAWLNAMKGYPDIYAGHVDGTLVAAIHNFELDTFEILVEEQDTIMVAGSTHNSQYGTNQRFEFKVGHQTLEGFYAQKQNGEYSIALYKRDRVTTKELKKLLSR